jgi:hypothetical protein
MALEDQIRSLLSFLNLILFGSLDGSWTSTISLWAVRLLTLGLMLRTYIIPSILSLCSNHIRVRSISFRSIRGLYIKSGRWTLYIDRIALGRPKGDCPSRRSVLIEGLKVDIGKDGTKPSGRPTPRIFRRSLKLSDLSLYPLVFGFLSLLSAIYRLLEPHFRPLIRSFVVSSLRHIIHRLPGITQAFKLEVRSAEVTLAALPETNVMIEDIAFHTTLTFTELETSSGMENTEPNVGEGRHLKSFGVSNWRTRLMKSSKRTWDRAWGQTQGFASVSLKLKRVTGQTQLSLPHNS